MLIVPAYQKFIVLSFIFTFYLHEVLFFQMMQD